MEWLLESCLEKFPCVFVQRQTARGRCSSSSVKTQFWQTSDKSTLPTMQRQKKYKWCKCSCSHCLTTQKHHERTDPCSSTYINNARRAWDSFHHFLNKGQSASADWRSIIQACFWCSTRLLAAKFQNMLKNKDFSLHNWVKLSVTHLHLGPTNKFSTDIWDIFRSYQNSWSKWQRFLDFGFLCLFMCFFFFGSSSHLRQHAQHLNACVIVSRLNLNWTELIYLISQEAGPVRGIVQGGPLARFTNWKKRNHWLRIEKFCFPESQK